MTFKILFFFFLYINDNYVSKSKIDRETCVLFLFPLCAFFSHIYEDKSMSQASSAPLSLIVRPNIVPLILAIIIITLPQQARGNQKS